MSDLQIGYVTRKTKTGDVRKYVIVEDGVARSIETARGPRVVTYKTIDAAQAAIDGKPKPGAHNPHNFTLLTE